jgi:hypothetical protein
MSMINCRMTDEENTADGGMQRLPDQVLTLLALLCIRRIRMLVGYVSG